MIQLFFALLIGHVIADYPLQGDFLARAKNRSNPIPGVPFYQALGAHALMHAGTVWLITGNMYLGLIEFFLHSAIDDSKCTGKIGFNMDQFLHAACKIGYVMFLFHKF